jgi:hypothetical protein
VTRHALPGPALVGTGVALAAPTWPEVVADDSAWRPDGPTMAPELVHVLRRQLHAEAVAAVDWDGLRKCSTCQRPTGRPCVARSGRIVNGRPDGVETELEQPHAHRRPRVRRSGR